MDANRIGVVRIGMLPATLRGQNLPGARTEITMRSPSADLPKDWRAY